MNLGYSDEHEALREKLRAFLDKKLPEDLARKVRLGKRLTKEDHETWHALLQERNWYAGTGRRNTAARAGTRSSGISSKRRRRARTLRAWCHSAS